jgi:hypothetical protein
MMQSVRSKLTTAKHWVLGGLIPLVIGGVWAVKVYQRLAASGAMDADSLRRSMLAPHALICAGTAAVVVGVGLFLWGWLAPRREQ